MPWTPVSDAQSPNWSGVTVIGGAFQLGAFQPAFQITGGSGWAPVTDTQAPAWIPVA